MRFVFVHGACVKDGAWWWHRTGELLTERGIASEAPALPSCGETGAATGAEGPGLAEDVAVVRRLLTGSDEPTVVVAHSYGGIVIAEAAAGVETVRQLLLVSSYLPEVGESLSSFGDEEPAPFLNIDPEHGTFTVRSEALAETFLQDCDPEIQREAMDKTARQSLSVIREPVQSAAWQQVPSTYLVCAQDRGTPAQRQRDFARRASRVELEPLDQLLAARLVEPAAQIPEQVDRLPAGQPRPQNHIARHVRQSPVQLDHVTPRIAAQQLDRAGIRSQQPQEHADRRRLPRTVGAEKAVNLTGGHLEIEPVQSGE